MSFVSGANKGTITFFFFFFLHRNKSGVFGARRLCHPDPDVTVSGTEDEGGNGVCERRAACQLAVEADRRRFVCRG